MAFRIRRIFCVGLFILPQVYFFLVYMGLAGSVYGRDSERPASIRTEALLAVPSYQSDVVATRKHPADEYRASSPPNRKQVLFVETGGRGNVTARMSCAVESALRANPGMEVHLYSVRPYKQGPDQATAAVASPFVPALSKFPKFSYTVLDPEDIFRSTPFEKLNVTKFLRKSFVPAVHLSDILRLALLYKLGGICLDLDFVVKRPLDEFENAVLGDGPVTAIGMMSFERNSKFLLRIMKKAAAAQGHWDWNGYARTPMMQVLRTMCHKPNGFNTSRCGNVTIVGKRLFLPTDWFDWRKWFQAKHADAMLAQSNGSYAVHVNGNFSTRTPTEPGCGYRRLAAVYCPMSLNLSLTLDGTF